MNNKAQVLSEGILLFWRLALIIAVIFVIALLLTPIFSSKIDVRPVETAFLSNVVMNCIAPNGVFDTTKELSECFSGEFEDYRVNVSVTSLDKENSLEKVVGDPVIRTNCEITTKGVTFIDSPPSCLKQKYYVLIGDELERGALELFIGLRKFKGNV